jgi:hypothetical protein
MDDRDNYAVLMRVAMLSSLEGRDATANLGFRCARSTHETHPHCCSICAAIAAVAWQRRGAAAAADSRLAAATRSTSCR